MSHCCMNCLNVAATFIYDFYEQRTYLSQQASYYKNEKIYTMKEV